MTSNAGFLHRGAKWRFAWSRSASQLRGVRDELARLWMLDDAILAERDPTMWLN
jgi:hypothetical protein